MEFVIVHPEFVIDKINLKLAVVLVVATRYQPPLSPKSQRRTAPHEKTVPQGTMS